MKLLRWPELLPKPNLKPTLPPPLLPNLKPDCKRQNAHLILSGAALVGTQGLHVAKLVIRQLFLDVTLKPMLHMKHKPRPVPPLRQVSKLLPEPKLPHYPRTEPDLLSGLFVKPKLLLWLW